MIFKVLGLFVNTVTADDKYFLLTRNNLLEDLQMHISRKKNLFLNFFLRFQNLDPTFTISEKKGDPHGRCIFEHTDSEKRG